jgi:hypothetical protein
MGREVKKVMEVNYVPDQVMPASKNKAKGE